MLCDGARIGQDGKMYIFGGQWDRIQAASIPFNHPLMAIALVIKVEYHEALREHDLTATLRHADGEPAGPKVAGKFEVGHPPGLKPGAPISVPLALEIPGVSLDGYGRFEWLVEVDGAEVGRLPITVSPAPNHLPVAEP